MPTYRVIAKKTIRHNRKRYAPKAHFEDDNPNLEKNWPDRFHMINVTREDVEAQVDATKKKAARKGGRKGGRKLVHVDAQVEQAPKPPKPPKNPPSGLRMVPKGANAYDVVNGESGKRLNTRPLTQEEAQELIDEVNNADGNSKAGS